MKRIYKDCNVCSEVQVLTFSSLNVISECGCGVKVLDTMVEEDRLYPVYQQVFGTFAMGRRDNDPIKTMGSLKSITHNKKYKGGA